MDKVAQQAGYRKIYVSDKDTVKIEKESFGGIPYSKMSRLNTKYSKEEKDLLDILGSISKPSRDFFLLVKRNMNWKTNKATLSPPASRSESTMRARAVRELRSNNLLRRVTGNTFIISPFHLVPSTKEHEILSAESWRESE